MATDPLRVQMENAAARADAAATSFNGVLIQDENTDVPVEGGTVPSMSKRIKVRLDDLTQQANNTLSQAQQAAQSASSSAGSATSSASQASAAAGQAAASEGRALQHEQAAGQSAIAAAQSAAQVNDRLSIKPGMIDAEASWEDIPSLGQPNGQGPTNAQAVALTARDKQLRQRLDDIGNQEDLAKGASLIGYRGRSVSKKLDDVIDARDFGFQKSASSSENRDSILRAKAAAGSARIKIFSEDDYELGGLVLTNSDVDLSFEGKGVIQRKSGSRVLQIQANYSDIYDVLDISRTTLVVNGNTCQATRVKVADASNYSRGDIAKIVSDDVDPSAVASTPPRRVGECKVVIQSDPANGYIWLSGILRYAGLYANRIRVGKMKKTTTKIRGLKILSSVENNNNMIYLAGLYRPDIEFEVINHFGIVSTLKGCYGAIVYPSGSGVGASNGNLGYLVDDISSHYTQIIRPRGSFFRHVTTTGIDPVDDLEANILGYGASYRHTVIDGVADACQGVPWDDHPGAVESVWINCSASNFAINESTAQAAFQMRGVDSRIINPMVDDSFAYTLRLTNLSMGSYYIDGGMSKAGNPFYCSHDTGEGISLTLNNHTHVKKTSFPLFSAHSIKLIINGGEYGFTGISQEGGKIFDVAGGGKTVLNGPRFVLTTAANNPASTRFFGTSGAVVSSVVGSCTLFCGRNDAGPANIIRDQTGVGDFRIRAAWVGGAFPSAPISGTPRYLKYAVSNTVSSPGTVSTNIVDFQDFLANLSGL